MPAKLQRMAELRVLAPPPSTNPSSSPNLAVGRARVPRSVTMPGVVLAPALVHPSVAALSRPSGIFKGQQRRRGNSLFARFASDVTPTRQQRARK